MRGLSREFFTLTLILVAMFLVLSHASGFAKGLGALSRGYARDVKALQGR
jgi:hypothetical protein